MADTEVSSGWSTLDQGPSQALESDSHLLSSGTPKSRLFSAPEIWGLFLRRDLAKLTGRVGKHPFCFKPAFTQGCDPRSPAWAPCCLLPGGLGAQLGQGSNPPITQRRPTQPCSASFSAGAPASSPPVSISVSCMLCVCSRAVATGPCLLLTSFPHSSDHGKGR